MKIKNHVSSKVIKIGVAVLALANLAALFLFNYGLPDYTFDQAAVIPEESKATDASIRFTSDILTYDGTGDISMILMDGVTATDADGSDLTDKLKTSFKASNLPNEKKITYSVKTADGTKLKAERTLRLENYEGPTINVSNNLPTIKESELDNAVSALADAGALHAEDGYGNDITSAIKVKWSADESNIGYFVLNFTLENRFADSVSAKASVQAQLSKPLIALTQQEISIPLNDESFSAMDYVKAAIDTDGTPIDKDSVELNGYVQRDTPGTYPVTYTVTGPESGLTAEATLNVTVKDTPAEDSDDSASSNGSE